MSIQQSVNQALTGATFLIQQSPYYQTLASRQAGKKAFQKAEAIQEVGREEIRSALRDIPKEANSAERAKAVAEQAQANADLERNHAEEVKKMRGYEPEAVEAEKIALHAETMAKQVSKKATEIIDEEEEKRRKLASAEEAKTDALSALHNAMYASQKKQQAEAELSRLQSEEFRKRVFEGIYRKGERL